MSLEVLNSVINDINEGVIISNDKMEIIQVNKSCEKITGYTQDEVLGKNPSIFSSSKTPPEVYNDLKNSMQNNAYWMGEIWNRHKNGEVYPIILRVSKTQIAGENYFYAIFSDVSLNQESKDELFHLAYHDALTNLPNRLKLKAQLEYVINNSKRNNLKFAILFLDLDNFKEVNDTLGHASGDELLVNLSNKLKSVIRTNDMIARVGGDEFIIVLSDITDCIFIERVCNKILAFFTKPIKIKGQDFKVGVSIGISLYPDTGTDIESLLHNADLAMYTVKQNSKNNFGFYSKEVTTRFLEHSQREKDLIYALENNEFIVHFQPEIDTSTNKVFSLEVLTRWQKDKTLLYPGNFLTDLEVTNNLIKFEQIVLKQACVQLKTWHDRDIFSGSISVNISGKYLESGFLYDDIVKLLDETKLNPSSLELEFSEENVMKTSTVTVDTLKKLANLGIVISLDNFGKGFSSLNYLRQCAISRLKIDKSYIDSLLEEKNDEDIIKSIIEMGNIMGITVIAEGIEVPAQDEILKKNSCTKVQGYFYAKPMCSNEFELWYYNFINQGVTL